MLTAARIPMTSRAAIVPTNRQRVRFVGTAVGGGRASDRSANQGLFESLVCARTPTPESGVASSAISCAVIQTFLRAGRGGVPPTARVFPGDLLDDENVIPLGPFGFICGQEVAVVHESDVLLPEFLDRVAAELRTQASEREDPAVVSLNIQVDADAALIDDVEDGHLLAVEDVPVLVVFQAHQLLARSHKRVAHAHHFADVLVDAVPGPVETADRLHVL